MGVGCFEEGADKGCGYQTLTQSAALARLPGLPLSENLANCQVLQKKCKRSKGLQVGAVNASRRCWHNSGIQAQTAGR
jgi:hypothetical protein